MFSGPREETMCAYDLTETYAVVTETKEYIENGLGPVQTTIDVR